MRIRRPLSIRAPRPAATVALLLATTAAWPQSRPPEPQDGAVVGLADLPASLAVDRPPLNFYGVSGAVDTPTADGQLDGDLSVTVASFAGITRTTLSFQFAPRIQGSFRYSRFADLNYEGFDDYYDRSFDVSLQLLKERRYLPALKIGLQDFVGTGLFSGEYLVATKNIGPVKVSAGLGWGRFAGLNDIGSPFGGREESDVGRGGEFNAGEWFRGPASPFASVMYRPTDRLTLMAEYSSDAYEVETGNARLASDALFERESDFNFGASYRVNESLALGAYWLYGSELGVNVNLTLNPNRPPVRGSLDPAPGAVIARPDRAALPAAYTTAWVGRDSVRTAATEALEEDLDAQGITLEAIALDGDAVTVRVRNRRYNVAAQAVGRTARALTRTMPPSVETFRIVPSPDGLPASEIVLRRSDLEALVNAPDAEAQLLAVTGLNDAVPLVDANVNGDVFPRFDWSIGPYVRNSYFDPDAPLRIGAGLRLAASYEPVPGLVFAGAVTKKVVGNLDDAGREQTDSNLPAVRTSLPIYEREGDPGLERLTGAYYFRPGENLYARATAGYLERMFAGVSGEVLWKRVDSRLGLGAEVNWAKQRAPDLGLGLADGSDGVDEYDVVTGHLSAYYQFDGGYQAQLDVGRYLAGDVGATLSIDRTFANGWTVGAFATKTDVSSEDFGEGSFDKGIRFSIPLAWFTGSASQRRIGTTLRPVTRDGGARLSVPGRLYGKVVDWHRADLEDEWGRVWR
ncbi:hypothetical protein OCGS_1984 [Oceaniovalibus guishaninsula JLT2003]|uniref:Exopolysaccharide biosynthesis protein YbjH n=1 Tax=Oceaniovalibus guishaninsula JLT2003 TaxID=1231392 RepID=K2H8U9_9RHOB|nr:YjbH domain-containing protein [Oceaniovalibus guishaninsula]EKE44003.1 hypothetical protein OCGS_1984 [Oceaniovalibus guishaninsula JLT2003]